MSHELLLKLVLTTLSVWLVLELARRAGARVAGLVAGLPISTAPGLVLLGLAHGDGFAAAAGVGSLLATAICAAFAWAYASMRQRGPLRALLAGSSAACVAAAVAAWLAIPPRAGAGLAFATAIAISLLVASRLRPESGIAVVKPRMPRARRAALPLMIGVVNTTVCALSDGLPAIVCGLLFGLPLVCAVLAVQQHRHGGSESAIHVLRGYVDGLFSRCVFTLVFILSAKSAGWPLGLALACIAWALASPCRNVGWRIVASAIAYFSTYARSSTWSPAWPMRPEIVNPAVSSTACPSASPGRRRSWCVHGHGRESDVAAELAVGDELMKAATLVANGSRVTVG